MGWTRKFIDVSSTSWSSQKNSFRVECGFSATNSWNYTMRNCHVLNMLQESERTWHEKLDDVAGFCRLVGNSYALSIIVLMVSCIHTERSGFGFVHIKNSCAEFRLQMNRNGCRITAFSMRCRLYRIYYRSSLFNVSYCFIFFQAKFAT